jgi:putative two-component system response regulator
VFDALISRRVYKEAFPLEHVLQIIRNGRGNHFDPAVVDAFEACLDEFLAIAQRFSDEAESVL